MPILTAWDFIQKADQSFDACNNDKSDSGLSDDEDINVGNDSDESFNTDSKSDTPDNDSDEECPEYLNQMSEGDDSISETHETVEASPRTLADKVDPPVDEKAFNDPIYSSLGVHNQKHDVDTQDDIHMTKSIMEGQEHLCELKKHLGRHELETFPKTSTPIPNIGGVHDSLRQAETVSLQASCATTTLAISAVSSACSKPVSLSISTSNVKSEHVWIPPTVSPSSQCHRTQQGNSRNSQSPPNTNSKQQKLYSKDGDISASNKDSITQASCVKAEHSLECEKPVLPISITKNSVSNVELPYRDLHVLVSQVTQNAKGAETEVISKEIHGHDPTQVNRCRSEPSNDKSNKDRDREERCKLRLKEDKVRKEREERIKKDRERDERHDRERREEKEAERLREEERDRKVHSESKSVKDMPAASPSSDPSRRPTGGVAEAAAFSDYMRFLAAGHGHSFM